MVSIVRRLSGLRGLYVLALVCSDFLMLRLAFVLAYRLRLLGEPGGAAASDPPSTYDSRSR